MANGFLALMLPLPPTLNQSYFCTQTGGGIEMVLTQRAKAYKEMTEETVLIAWRNRGLKINQGTRFYLGIDMVLEENYRDVDANVKLVMDAVMSGVKAATDLDGLSGVRVFEVRIRKLLIAEMKSQADPGIGVVLMPYYKGGLGHWPKKAGKSW